MQPHSQPPASPGRRRIALALPLLGGVPWSGGAFAKAAGGAEARRGAWTLMGTRVDIVAEGPDAALLRHAMDQAIAEMRRLGLAVFDFDASALAMQLGNIRLGNTVMLGAMSDRLPFPADVLRKAVLDRFGTRKPELLELNREAFELGRAAVAQPAPAQAIA